MQHALAPSKRLRSFRLRSHPQLMPVGTTAGRTRGYAERITVGKPGRCPQTPVLAISLFDNSGSVTGGNDPIGQRFLEAYVAITRIGNRCKCGRDQAATIHFDTPTTLDLPPTPITKHHHEEIGASLAIPPDGAGVSLLGQSLTAARDLAERQSGSHRIVLVVLSDFELFDDYLDELIAFPGDVHAVGLRAAPPQQLVEAPSVEVTHIDYSSRPGALARTVFTALTRTRPRAKPLPAAELLGSD
jgi:hypothetical protein